MITRHMPNRDPERAQVEPWHLSIWRALLWRAEMGIEGMVYIIGRNWIVNMISRKIVINGNGVQFQDPGFGPIMLDVRLLPGRRYATPSSFLANLAAAVARIIRFESRIEY